MTVIPELLPYVLEMMQSRLTGTINLTNPGLVSHNEILDMYKEIVDPEFTYKNFSIEEQRAILAADRSNNYLDTTKLESLFPEVLNIKESIRNMLYQYKDTLPKKENTTSICPINITNLLNSLTQKKSTNLLITGGCGFIGSNFINYYFPKQKFVYPCLWVLDPQYHLQLSYNQNNYFQCGLI